MRIYKLCPCCGRTIFLVMEMELGSAFGSKDNMPHSDTNHEEDWETLSGFLTLLKESHGPVYLSLNEKEESKIAEDYKEMILSWKEKREKTT
jgi:hypothetical protein